MYIRCVLQGQTVEKFKSGIIDGEMMRMLIKETHFVMYENEVLAWRMFVEVVQNFSWEIQK